MKGKDYSLIYCLIAIFILFMFGCSGDVFHNYKKERDTISIPYTPDTTPPQVVNALAIDYNRVKVVFDEAIDQVTATDYKNYYIQGNNRVNVLDTPAPEVVDDDKSVILTVSTGLQYGLYHGREYSLLVQNVKDVNGNALLNAVVKFVGKGAVVAEIWTQVGGELQKLSEEPPYQYFNAMSKEFIIKVNGTDDGWYSYSLDDSSFSSDIECSTKLVLNNLTEGIHSLRVIGKNKDGKMQDISQATEVQFFIDTMPPVATLNKVPESVTNSKEIAILVSGNDVIYYRYRINNESFSNSISVSTPIIRKNLLDGNYRLEVVGIDYAGNVQVTPTSYEWSVQSGSTIKFISKPERYTRLKNVSIVLGGDDIYFYRYSINNQVWSGYISIDQPIVLNNLNDGDYTIRIVGAIIPGDSSTETPEISYTWTVDTVAPECTLSNLPLNPTNKQKTAIVVSSVNGDVVAYRYKLIIGGSAGQLSGVYSVTTPIELSGLGENVYTIKVMGIDRAGNMQSEANATQYTWSVDITPPTVELGNLPAKNTNVNIIDISIGPNDVVAYRFALNSVSWSQEINKNINISYINMQDGIYTLSVIGRDLAGNWQSFQIPTVHVWEIDTVPPEVILLNKPPVVTNLTSADFVIGGIGVIKYRYRLDDGDWSQEFDRIEYPNIAIQSLSEGTHTIEVKGGDKAGNWQNTPTIYQWTINTSMPTAILSNTPPYFTKENSISVTVSGVEYYRYKLDNGSWSDEIGVSETISANNLSEGYHILRVIGKNAMGQWQEVGNATTCEWQVDTIPPIAQLDNKPQSPTNNQSINVKVYGVGVYAYKYSLNNPDPRGSAENLILNNDTIRIDNIPGGTHTLYVIARDEAGNWQEVSNATTHIWTIDTSTPVAQFDPLTLPPNITNQTGINIKVTGNGIVTYKYKIDGTTWSGEIDINDPIIRIGLSEGNHTIAVIGKNAAGTWQAVSDATSYSWVIDITPPTPPDIVLSNLPGNPTNETSINVIVSGTGITHYRYKINNENWSDPIEVKPENTIQRSNLPENTYTLYVIAKDEAGNWTPEENAKTYTWRIDTTSPIAAITNRPDNPTNQDWAEFIIAGTGIVQYKYKLNNGVWSDWIDVSQHISLTNLPDGMYTLYICGRKSATPPHYEQQEVDATTYTWEVDTVAPVAVLGNLPDNPTTDTTLNITVGGSQVVAYRYRINNGAWIPASSEIIKEFPITMSGLTPGNYQIDVIARDLAGNWQQTPTSYSWTITPPPLVSPATVDTGDYTTSSALSFSWVRPMGTADVKIQIASDTNFNNIVYEAIIGNVDSYTLTVTDTDIQTYYARVSVNDQSGRPLYDPSWKPWGARSNGITLTGGVFGLIRNAVGFTALSGATVEVRKMIDNTLISSMQTDINGEFAFVGLPIGSNYYKIIASLNGYNNATKQNVTITLGGQTAAGILYLVPTTASNGTITGLVMDANDAAKLSGVTVQVSDWQNILRDTKTTQTGGTFTTATLPAGVYSVKFSNTGYYDLVVDNIVVNGNVDMGRQAICAYLVEPMVRTIALWGSVPQDLDLHVVGPTAQTVTEADTTYNNPQNRFHVGYIGYTTNAWQYNFNELTGLYERGPGGSSTVPDRTGTKSTTALVQDVYPGNPNTGAGYGPEAINLWRYGGVQYAKGIYTYTLRNYSGTNWYAGGRNIIIRIYDSQGMVREIIMPQGATDPGNTTRDWKAVKINIQGNSRNKRYIFVPTQNIFFNAGFDRNKAGFDW